MESLREAFHLLGKGRRRVSADEMVGAMQQINAAYACGDEKVYEVLAVCSSERVVNKVLDYIKNGDLFVVTGLHLLTNFVMDRAYEKIVPRCEIIPVVCGLLRLRDHEAVAASLDVLVLLTESQSKEVLLNIAKQGTVRTILKMLSGDHPIMPNSFGLSALELATRMVEIKTIRMEFLKLAGRKAVSSYHSAIRRAMEHQKEDTKDASEEELKPTVEALQRMDRACRECLKAIAWWEKLDGAQQSATGGAGAGGAKG